MVWYPVGRGSRRFEGGIGVGVRQSSDRPCGTGPGRTQSSVEGGIGVGVAVGVEGGISPWAVAVGVSRAGYGVERRSRRRGPGIGVGVAEIGVEDWVGVGVAVGVEATDRCGRRCRRISPQGRGEVRRIDLRATFLVARNYPVVVCVKVRVGVDKRSTCDVRSQLLAEFRTAVENVPTLQAESVTSSW